MFNEIVFLGLAINLTGLFLYVRDMFKGKTKPNRVTACLWALQGAIAFTAGLSAGVTWALVPVAAAFLSPFTVFVLSFSLKQAYWKLGLFDWICGSFAILALALWYITGNPSIAIALAIIADLLAALPTIKKSWTHPRTETGIAYICPVFGYSMAFLVMETYSFAEMAFPLYNIVICSSIAALIYTGPWRERKQQKAYVQ